jgi:hypothetical protein
MRKLQVLSMLVVLALVVFTGCTKEEDLMIPNQENVETSPTQRSSGVYYRGVSESILTNFVHYCQRKAGTYQGSPYYGEGYLTVDVARKACCPTSYMMAAACLAHHKDGSSTQYNATGDKLSGIIGSFSGSNYRYLENMSNYCNNNDGSFLDSEKKLSCTSRSEIKNFIENSLAQNEFVLININAKIYDLAKVNNSSLFQNSSNNPDLSSGSSLYISENNESTNNIGAHVILIIRLDKDVTGDGIVQYIDPLSITRSGSNRKYVRYSKLLNSNLISGYNYYYDAISVGLK